MHNSYICYQHKFKAWKSNSFASTYINGVVSLSQLLPNTYHIWLFVPNNCPLVPGKWLTALSHFSRMIPESTEIVCIQNSCVLTIRHMYILKSILDFCSCWVWLLTRSGLDRCPFRAPAILVMIRLFISSVPLRLSLVNIHSSERTAILTCSVPCLKLKSISSLIMPCTYIGFEIYSMFNIEIQENFFNSVQLQWTWQYFVLCDWPDYRVFVGG